MLQITRKNNLKIQTNGNVGFLFSINSLFTYYISPHLFLKEIFDWFKYVLPISKIKKALPKGEGGSDEYIACRR